MRSSFRVVATALLALVVSVQGLAAQHPLRLSDFVVKEVAQGMDTGTVARYLGRPDSVAQDSDLTRAAPIDAWFFGNLSILFIGAKVHGFWIRGPGAATRRGLRVGDPITRATRLYGVPSTVIAEPKVGEPTALDWASMFGARGGVIHVVHDSTVVTAIYLGASID